MTSARSVWRPVLRAGACAGSGVETTRSATAGNAAALPTDGAAAVTRGAGSDGGAVAGGAVIGAPPVTGPGAAVVGAGVDRRAGLAGRAGGFTVGVAAVTTEADGG